jgi:hypothetical protein
MTIPQPFISELPLKQNPFRSRSESQMDAAKNYFAVGFKPGFPLQASELNELQENFYIQQTLTQTMFANWHNMNYLQQNGVNMLATPWNGCTPVDPELVSFTSSGGAVNITFKAGWYLIKQNNFNGGFGVWVYNNNDYPVLSNYSNSSSSSLDGDYGIFIKQNVIQCTTNATAGINEDRSLQDSSNINVINGPCGAARLQAQIFSFGRVSGGEGTFLPIITASRPGSSVVVAFKNNYNIVVA